MSKNALIGTNGLNGTNGLIGESGLIGENGLTTDLRNIIGNNSIVADGLKGVSGHLQNNNIQTLHADATNYRFMRVSRQGLSVSDQTEFDTFKPVVQVKRSSIIFDTLFNIVIGNELIQDFIIRIVNTFLSKWILLNENGSITFKGATLFNENINADKAIVSKGGFIDGKIEP